MAAKQMLNDPLVIGQPGHLHITLQWRDDYGTDGPVGRTWGDLQLWVKDTLVWGSFDRGGQPTGIRWSWVDLLDYLAIAWPYLEEEESYPIDFLSRFDAPSHLGELRGKARLRLRNLSEDEADREDELLRAFMSVHDLGEALQGASPPSVILLRQGHQMLAATVEREWTLRFIDTLDVLEQLGEAIARRINDLEDDRSILALQRWQARNALARDQRLEVATGLTIDQLREAWPEPLEGTSTNAGAYGLKAAARMIGTTISDSDLRHVLGEIAKVPVGTAHRIDSNRDLAADVLEDHTNDEPYEQGYALAQALRESLKQELGPIDPEALLRGWNVAIREIDIDSGHLDAIAVWGEYRRPTILINTRGRRSRLPRGRRSTYAHEICHLLVDTDGALPAVEVLGGGVPYEIERRANAFAAEFLLPRNEAGNALDRALDYVYSADERRQAIDSTVDQLANDFQVSHETAAWQLKRSGRLCAADELVLDPYFKSINAPFR